MAKANVTQMNALHGLITQYYADACNSGEELSSGTLAAINAHLKNNSVTMDVVESSPMQNLTSRFQELMDDDIKQRKEG